MDKQIEEVVKFAKEIHGEELITARGETKESYVKEWAKQNRPTKVAEGTRIAESDWDYWVRTNQIVKPRWYWAIIDAIEPKVKEVEK